MKVRPLIVAATAAAVALTATPSFAESVRVEYHDLNLATDKGRDTLERRLDAAAREVCGLGDARTGTRVPSADARKCYKDARKDFGEQFAGLLEKSKANKGG